MAVSRQPTSITVSPFIAAFRSYCSEVGSGPGTPVRRIRWLVRRFRSGPQSGCRSYVSRPRRIEPRRTDFPHRALLLVTSRSLCTVSVGVLLAYSTEHGSPGTDRAVRIASTYSTSSSHSLGACGLASDGTVFSTQPSYGRTGSIGSIVLCE